MANNLTGDFDIVAQVSIPAANRLLAAMHRAERFPHSLSLRVDDTPRKFPGDFRPTMVGVLDEFGDPPPDHNHIHWPDALSGESIAGIPGLVDAGAIVNLGALLVDQPPLVPSHILGRAQVQVSPPTVEVADASGTRIRARLGVRVRYFPDAGTAALAEYIRGELQITAAVSQMLSQSANVVEIDIRADSVAVAFVPSWSSRALSAEDITAIDLFVRNAVRTSVLPTNATLPQDVTAVSFKTLSGGLPALAMLLRMRAGSANPSGVNTVVLSGSDDFAVAVGAEFVQATFQPTLDSILSQQIAPVTIGVDTLFHTFKVTYSITLNGASIALEPGHIVLTLNGHAHTGTSWMPDFDFTVRQPFLLQPSGATANLVPQDPSINTSSWVVNLFSGAAQSGMRQARDKALADSGAYDKVRAAFNARSALGGLIDSLLTTPSRRPMPPVFAMPPRASLGYTGIGINPDGIVLHGVMSLLAWPPPSVAFEEIPRASNLPVAPGVFDMGSDYSALKSWIPGGTIDRFEWRSATDPPPGFVDENRFVLIHQPPPVSAGVAARTTVLAGFSPLCLTVRGSRLSSNGPIATQAVSATVCGVSGFSIFDDLAAVDIQPTIAVTAPGQHGLAIVGHMAAHVDDNTLGTPNLLVRFARRGLEGTEMLTGALATTNRRGTSAAVVVVAPNDVLSKATLSADVVYSADLETWTKRLGAEQSAENETFIVAPDGRVTWRHRGEIDAKDLAAALEKNLVAGPPVNRLLFTSSTRHGHPAPNFLFDYAPGRQLSVRKLAGRPATIVFWTTRSEPSIAAVREETRRAGNDAVVLAVNVGDPPDVVAREAKRHELSATIVNDVSGEIARGYGITVFPTIVSVEASGAVAAIRYGKQAGNEPEQDPPKAAKRSA